MIDYSKCSNYSSYDLMNDVINCSGCCSFMDCKEQQCSEEQELYDRRAIDIEEEMAEFDEWSDKYVRRVVVKRHERIKKKLK